MMEFVRYYSIHGDSLSGYFFENGWQYVVMIFLLSLINQSPWSSGVNEVMWVVLSSMMIISSNYFQSLW